MMEQNPDRPPAGVALDLVVRYAETDAMGVVHHSTYIVWFEAGRVAWMDAAGMPYRTVADGGHHLAVTKLQAEYRSPARFGDTVRVVTRATSLRSRQVCFAYDIYSADDGILLATGNSEHISVDTHGRPAKIPSQVLAHLIAGMERLARDDTT